MTVLVNWGLPPVSGLMQGRKTVTPYQIGTSTLTGVSDFPILETNKAMRRLEAAIQTYRRDRGQFPPNAAALTTPTAYLVDLPCDPFAQGGAPIQWRVTDPKGGSWRIYSVGPDGVDQKGEIPYDPTNGSASAGDIIRPGSK